MLWMPSLYKLSIYLEKCFVLFVIRILLEFEVKRTLSLNYLLRKSSHCLLHPQSTRITKTYELYLSILVRLLRRRYFCLYQLVLLCILPDISSTSHKTIYIESKNILIGMKTTLMFDSFLDSTKKCLNLLESHFKGISWFRRYKIRKTFTLSLKNNLIILTHCHHLHQLSH